MDIIQRLTITNLKVIYKSLYICPLVIDFQYEVIIPKNKHFKTFYCYCQSYWLLHLRSDNGKQGNYSLSKKTQT